jgi:hypothetical protein
LKGYFKYFAEDGLVRNHPGCRFPAEFYLALPDAGDPAAVITEVAGMSSQAGIQGFAANADLFGTNKPMQQFSST